MLATAGLNVLLAQSAPQAPANLRIVADGTPPPPPPPPPPTGTWPASWTAPIFANVVSRGLNSYNMSGTSQDFEIVTTSGEPVVGCQNFTARRFRARGREGIRFCGSNVLAEDFYLEITGSGSDHADGVQAYGGGGQTNMKNLVLRRGNIILRGASNAGIFMADGAGAELTLESVRVDAAGAPNGALFIANVSGDHGCVSLKFNDVLVSPSVRFVGLGSGGGCNIIEWTNVRYFDGRPVPRP
jgi:hypothetical protein